MIRKKSVSCKMAEEGYLKRESGAFTTAIHGGFDPRSEATWPFVPSISVAAVFEQEAPGRDREYVYSRIGNPTREVLEKSLAELENAKYALCFSSGLGAITIVTSLLSTGDHIVAAQEIYGGTIRLFKQIFSRMGIQTTFVDATDPKNFENAMTEKTKLVWIETPSNPLLKVTDIKKVAEIVHKQEGVLLAVDNTFLTPYFQRPLDLGADISMLSITKYINGHNDIVMGSLSTNNESLYEQLHFLQHGMGITPSPQDCYQVFRSIKTLPLRMEQHMKNALALAKYLENHPQVEKVMYAGLPNHPQYELTKKQCYGMSGMLSFYLKGNFEETKEFIKALKMTKYAGSLGGYETTLVVPFYMSHCMVPTEDKIEVGITENLIRVTVGLEAPDDIIDDFNAAFKHILNIK